MSQLTIKISDKADALIAQLQKEIFNRRRKKVSAEGVVETLLESGAKSQSDKRFATSWQNLVADIERAAMVAQTYGSKPSSLSDEEWALVLSHRTRSGTAPESKRAARPRAASTATAKAAASPAPARRRRAASATSEPEAFDLATSPAPKARGTRANAKPRSTRTVKTSTTTTAKAKVGTTRRTTTTRKRATAAPESATPESAAPESPTPAKAKAAPKTTTRKTTTGRSSVAKRMAKAASRLASAPITAITTTPAPAPAPAISGNGVDNGLAAPMF
jgi:pyruvate/2-oxoglutarate dehydrogenase complex dihydrolipoamide acyltransferase (E2) component